MGPHDDHHPEDGKPPRWFIDVHVMRAVPARRQEPFRIRRSRIHGSGAFAVRRIRKGARVVEYRGERLSAEEVDRRYTKTSRGADHTLLFFVDASTYIDATHEGNSARFFNHSCTPNCEAVLEGGRVFIEAIADIAVGAELTYDYALEPSDRPRRTWRRAYGCRCGTPHCRGTMVDALLAGKRSRRG